MATFLLPMKSSTALKPVCWFLYLLPVGVGADGRQRRRDRSPGQARYSEPRPPWRCGRRRAASRNRPGPAAPHRRAAMSPAGASDGPGPSRSWAQRRPYLAASALGARPGRSRRREPPTEIDLRSASGTIVLPRSELQPEAMSVARPDTEGAAPARRRRQMAHAVRVRQAPCSRWSSTSTVIPRKLPDAKAAAPATSTRSASWPRWRRLTPLRAPRPSAVISSLRIHALRS